MSPQKDRSVQNKRRVWETDHQEDNTGEDLATDSEKEQQRDHGGNAGMRGESTTSWQEVHKVD